jgi:hypothetical protein
MKSSTDCNAIWTPEAKAKIQQEFGWGGGTLFEKYSRFLAEGGWAKPGETVVEAFAEWARKNGPA